jgi:hypothetical protein
MPDQLLPIPQVPEGLREAAQRGILIPFIGAGVSRLAGCPSWTEFADAALRWLIFDGKFTYSQLDQIRQLHPRVKLSLARTLAAEKNTVIDFRTLLHPKARREHEKGCRLYRSLFTLGKTFVTTNYDEWLDERLPEPTPAAIPAVQPAPADTPPGKPIRVVHKVDELLPALLSEPNSVIHLHGSLRDPAGMILTTRDYVRHYANDRLLADPQRENRVLTFLDFLFQGKNRSVCRLRLRRIGDLGICNLEGRPPSRNYRSGAATLHIARLLLTRRSASAQPKILLLERM